jgi:hypothetical protein
MRKLALLLAFVLFGCSTTTTLVNDKGEEAGLQDSAWRDEIGRLLPRGVF